MSTSATLSTLSPRHLPGLLVAALVSLTTGAIAGIFSLTGTVLMAILIGLGAMIAIGMKSGNAAASSATHLAVGIGMICASFGAIVTALVLR